MGDICPKQVRRLPIDLAGAVVFTALVNAAVFLPIVGESPIRALFGLIFVLFVPGYVFVAALFPEAKADESSTSETSESTSWSTETFRPAGIDRFERVALSFGLSIAIVPVIGLILNVTWGIQLVPVMLALTSFTLVTTTIAAVRRWKLPSERRFRVPYHDWYSVIRDDVLESGTRRDTFLNVLVVISVVLAASTVTFAAVVPQGGESFSAVYILSENDDGELVADDYPTQITQGEQQTITVGVDNHEYQTMNYTIVLLEQAVTIDGNETTVEEQRELDRFKTRLAHNKTWHHSHELEPTMTGENVRLVWLLYLGGDEAVPDVPSMETTEYHVRLWVDVESN